MNYLYSGGIRIRNDQRALFPGLSIVAWYDSPSDFDRVTQMNITDSKLGKENILYLFSMKRPK